MSSKQTKYISVFIPTFNGEKYIAECLNAVLKQEIPSGYELELMVTDSGSRDKTVEILKGFRDKIKLKEIENKYFGHGKTRMEAIREAKGEFVCFLTQDATPAHDRWLISLIEPFFIAPNVGCVFGAQVPRTDAVPTIKREVATAFGSLGGRNSLTLHRNQSLVDAKPTNGLDTFFSDVNSAMRREILMGPVPLRDLKYAEDQALAEDMQTKRYLVAYAAQAEVWHSNEYTAKQYFHRKFDEFIGLQESVASSMKMSKKSLLLGWIRPTIYDIRFTLRDRGYGTRQKLRGIFLAPAYNIAAKAGQYNAIKHLHDERARKRMSLESKARD